MKLHPLTPRKPALPAMTAGALAALVVAAVGLALHFIAFPSVAWLPAYDEARIADARFLLLVLQGLVGDAGAGSGVFARIDGVLNLPWAAIETAIALDLAIPLGIRLGSIGLASLFAGMEIHRLALAGAIAQPAVWHISGPKLLSGRAAKAALLSAWHRRYGGSRTGIALAKGLTMPRMLETEHMLICGGTGAGKTSILQSMMNGAIERGDRMLALDVKGDVTAKIPTNNVALLSLDDARSSRWDLGRDVVSREDAEELAIELVPDTSDPSWSAGARRVLACLVGHLQDEHRRSSRNWSWAELERLLASPIEALHAIVLERDPATAVFLDVSQDETRKQAMSFYLVLIANALPLVSACACMGPAKGPGVSFRRWVKAEGGPQVLILRQSQRHPELSATIARLGLKFIADAGADRAAEAAAKPVWLMLDELPQIGKSPAVPRLAAIGRSAGIRLVVTVQSPAQLREIYGQEGAQHLLDNLTTKIVGRVSAGKTASEIAEHWIGRRTVEFWEQSTRGENGRMQGELRREDIPVVAPELLSGELGLRSRVDGKPLVRALVVGHGDICLLEWPVGLWPDRRPSRIDRRRKVTAVSAAPASMIGSVRGNHDAGIRNPAS